MKSTFPSDRRNSRTNPRSWIGTLALVLTVAAIFAIGLVGDVRRGHAAEPNKKPVPLAQTLGVLNVQFTYERTDTVDEKADGRSSHSVEKVSAMGHLMQRVMIQPTGEAGSIAFALGQLPPNTPSQRQAEYSGSHTYFSESHERNGPSMTLRRFGNFDVQSSDAKNPDGIRADIFASEVGENLCIVRLLLNGNYTEKTQIDGDTPVAEVLDGPTHMVHTSQSGSQLLDLNAEEGFEPAWPADYAPAAARQLHEMSCNQYGTSPLSCSGAKTTYSPKNGWTVTFKLSQKNPLGKTTTLNGGMTTIAGTETITMTAKLTPGDPPPAKMIIAPSDATGYDNWLPIPVSDDAAVQKIYGTGVPLSFTATIKPREAGRDPPPGTIDFYLRDVSKNAGKCGNDPRSGGGGDGGSVAGLRFAKNQAGLTVDPNDSTHAYTTDLVTSASVVVEATDAGAYGRLYAESQELGLNAVYERTNQVLIPVPRDDDDNHIAYAWEKQQGILGKALPATSDDEDQPFPKHRGDGLSIYDQYRGFVLRLDDGKGNPIQKHQRIDVKSKNVFVRVKEDDAAAALIRQSAQQFGISTGFSVHFLYDDKGLNFDDGQLGKSPYPHWLNYNADASLAAVGCPRQYAIWIISKAAPEPNVYGRTVPIPPFKDDDAETPKNVDYIGIFRDNATARFDTAIAAYPTLRQTAATNPAWYAGTRAAWNALHAEGKINDDFPAIAKYMSTNESDLIDQLVEFSIIHEMAHATGVQHHHLKDALAGAPGQEQQFFAKGNPNCPMRYWGNDLKLSLLEYDGKWNVTKAPDGTRWKFCDDECQPNFHLRD